MSDDNEFTYFELGILTSILNDKIEEVKDRKDGVIDKVLSNMLSKLFRQIHVRITGGKWE